MTPWSATSTCYDKQQRAPCLLHISLDRSWKMAYDTCAFSLSLDRSWNLFLLSVWRRKTLYVLSSSSKVFRFIMLPFLPQTSTSSPRVISSHHLLEDHKEVSFISQILMCESNLGYKMSCLVNMTYFVNQLIIVD